MKHIDMTLHGHTWPMALTAEALFCIYDRYGVVDDILGVTKALEPSAYGWRQCCWLCALLLYHGEMQRRYLGGEPRDTPTMEELRCSVSAAEAIIVQQSVVAALQQGFERGVPDAAAEREINLVLAEREAAEKKTPSDGSGQSI